MTISLWCILIAALLPYAAVGFAKIGGDRYNNRDPRGWLARQQGFRARANAAQANSFEAFPFFAAAVLVAMLAHAPQGRVDLLASAFIVARVLYLAAYLADWHLLRSLLWLTGIAATVAIFVAGA
jgi:uncharacterized MAPEG superfamily protein